LNTIKTIKQEKAAIVAILALFLFIPLEHSLSLSFAGSIISFIIIFAVIIYCALSVAHHAEILAHKFGEPYGTLILTSSAVLVEIIIITIMMLSSANPELARDTIYSAVILDINGLLGIAAIIGGIKHGEQKYNIDSTNSYISMIIVAIGIAMVLPDFLPDSSLPTFEIFTIIIFVFLYVVFTRVQLKEHSYFFEFDYDKLQPVTIDPKPNNKNNNKAHNISGLYHAMTLIFYIIIIGVLAELLSVFMAENLKSLGLSVAIGAFIVALISASPELITAINAAVNNRMQTVVNIAVGASLATVLLTVPAILIVSKFLQIPINLGITAEQGLMLGLTMIVSIVNFNDGETNALEGFIHLILFVVFCYLLFV